jgi:hypothetical protein
MALPCAALMSAYAQTIQHTAIVLVPMRMRNPSADRRRPDYTENEERELRDADLRDVEDVAGASVRKAWGQGNDLCDRNV